MAVFFHLLSVDLLEGLDFWWHQTILSQVSIYSIKPEYDQRDWEEKKAVFQYTKKLKLEWNREIRGQVDEFGVI